MMTGSHLQQFSFTGISKKTFCNVPVLKESTAIIISIIKHRCFYASQCFRYSPAIWVPYKDFSDCKFVAL